MTTAAVLKTIQSVRVKGVSIAATIGAVEFGTETIDVQIFDAMGQRLIKLTLWGNADPAFAAGIVRETCAIVRA